MSMIQLRRVASGTCVKTPTKPGSFANLLDEAVGVLLQDGQAQVPRSSTIILNPPAMPMPGTGGAPKMLTCASGTFSLHSPPQLGHDGVGSQSRARDVGRTA